MRKNRDRRKNGPLEVSLNVPNMISARRRISRRLLSEPPITPAKVQRTLCRMSNRKNMEADEGPLEGPSDVGILTTFVTPYSSSDSVVWTAVGDTKAFPITVGAYQGSVLSLFLFSVILDDDDAQEQLP